MAILEVISALAGMMEKGGEDFITALDDLAGIRENAGAGGEEKKDGSSIDLNFGASKNKDAAEDDILVSPIIESDLLKLVLADKELDASKFIKGG